MTALLVLLAIIVLAGFLVIGAYNRLVALRQNANEAFADIDVQLKQRQDLVPNLVETVKGYAAHERGTLDEVDAPLDDANVDRFCTLINELGHTTATRFLVITHHRMTMARMDRLFGVTMAERGVSQLVSVDLETAERIREAG